MPEDRWPDSPPSLARAAGFLGRFLLPLVLICAGIGVAFPSPGRALADHGAILPTLAVLVFWTGLSMTFTEFANMRYAWRRTLFVLAATTAVLPLLAWLASRLVSAPPMRGGVLAAGVAPAEVASVALTGLAGGEVVVTAGLLAASTLLTVLLAGPILGVLGGHSAISPLALLSTLALVVALPLITGSTIRTIDPFGGRERALVEVLAVTTLLVLLWEIASQLRLDADYGVVAGALLAFLAGSAVLGWLLSFGSPARQRVAVVLPTAMRDFAVAAGIAASAFGVTAAAPLGIYGVMVLAFGAAAVRISRQRLRRTNDAVGAATADS
ncbi:MAG: bile acid:sodium symporter [Streptosporangiaceae bacterium]